MNSFMSPAHGRRMAPAITHERYLPVLYAMTARIHQSKQLAAVNTTAIADFDH